jgi:putative ABC transport system substrate-binding protein
MRRSSTFAITLASWLHQSVSMQRREFITLIGAALPPALLWPLAARAQPASRPKVGIVYPGPAAMAGPRVASLLDGLRTAGFGGPEQIELVLRVTAGDPARAVPLAAEVVESNVDVILAIGSGMVEVFRHATRTIPIVAIDLESDPVGSGLVASLARPGGNITGLFFDFPDFTKKWLELLKEALPRLQRIAVLWDPASARPPRNAIEQGANALSLQLDLIEVRSRSEFDGAFEQASKRAVDAVLMLPSPLIGANAQPLAELAIYHRLPAVTLFPDFARAGGLLAYGVNLLDLYRQTGVIVGKVLKGTKPSELPIERPTKFELVLNLRTAKRLGMDVPTGVLLRADEVIE